MSPANTNSGRVSDSQPREVMNVAVLAESELGSEAQRERRKRILDATMAIASKGGYEAVQMRAVADRADVAVGTLYRYFPSKVHLLVSALGREFSRIDAKTDRSAVAGGTPFQRLNFMVGKLNRAMQRNPLLTEAMTRAYVFADASAASEVDQVEKLIDSMFARAMSDGEPTEDQYHIARVISDVWLSNLLAWLTRRASATDVSKRLDLAVRLLIGDTESTQQLGRRPGGAPPDQLGVQQLDDRQAGPRRLQQQFAGPAALLQTRLRHRGQPAADRLGHAVESGDAHLTGHVNAMCPKVIHGRQGQYVRGAHQRGDPRIGLQRHLGRRRRPTSAGARSFPPRSANPGRRRRPSSPPTRR